MRPSDSSDAGSPGVNTVNLSSYTATIHALAKAHNIGYLDARKVLGAYAASNAAGYQNADGIHPSQTGFAAIGAAQYAQLIDPVAGYLGYMA